VDKSAGPSAGHAVAARRDLFRVYLTGADLFRANLTGADLFRFRADLFGARLSGVCWPQDAAVLDGWKLDTGSNFLKTAASADSGSAAAN
jgi:uncharacterized protein YjbI with pentapeptide repeats